MLERLKGVALDVTPIRESRDFRLLTGGVICSSLGTQAALVALPYQIYVLSHSAALVGLLGAFELGPMIVVSLLGGALADRHDRRLMLAVAQVGVIVGVRGAGGDLASRGEPPVLLLLILGGLLAGCTALDGVVAVGDGSDDPRAGADARRDRVQLRDPAGDRDRRPRRRRGADRADRRLVGSTRSTVPAAS